MARVSYRQHSRTRVADGVYANWSFKRGLRSFTLKPFSWLGWNTRSHETSIDTPGPGGLRVQPDGTGKSVGVIVLAVIGTALFRGLRGLLRAAFSPPKRRRGRRR